MKIAILTDGIMPFAVGGMQTHSHYLTKHLVQQGVEVMLVYCVNRNKNIPTHAEVLQSMGLRESAALKTVGLHFPYLGKIPGHYIRESYRYSVAVYERIKEDLRSCDFIYAKGFTAWRILEMKRNGEHLPPVGVKFHGYEMFQPAKSLKARLEQSMFKPSVVFNNRYADVVFSYGGKISELIESIGVEKQKIVEIPSGIDEGWLRKDTLTQDASRRFLFIGRNESRKGIADINKAIKSLEGINATFSFVGPIPESQRLQLGNVVYHGLVTDRKKIINLLDQTHVLVCPSHAEGMPNVILEAMSRGVAILATDVGAVNQLVSEQNGKVIPPQKPKILAREIKNLVETSDEELLLLRKNSLRMVEDGFLWTKIALSTLSQIRKRTHSK